MTRTTGDQDVTGPDDVVFAMPHLIDTHAHLDDPAFDADRADVIARAETAGVRDVIVIGYHAAIWERAAATATSIPGGHVALGIHPQHADEATPAALDRLRDAALAHRAVAIGETGVDLFRDGPPLRTQQDAFRAQLRIAADLGLPTVVHQRAAERETLDVLRDAAPGQTIVLHSFDAGPDTADLASERGWFIGVGGLMTRRTSEPIRALLRAMPIESLVLETDCPYLVPTGVKSRRNEPANVALIADRLAVELGQPVATIAAITTANARRAFALPRQ